MIHFAICDDEPAQVQFLSQLVTNWCAGRGEVCQIASFSSAEALLFAWEEAPLADILLLDILMGQMNGMELARKLRQKQARLQILFITGTPDFVFSGYDVEAVSYLMKPVRPERWIAAWPLLAPACPGRVRKSWWKSETSAAGYPWQKFSIWRALVTPPCSTLPRETWRAGRASSPGRTVFQTASSVSIAPISSPWTTWPPSPKPRWSWIPASASPFPGGNGRLSTAPAWTDSGVPSWAAHLCFGREVSSNGIPVLLVSLPGPVWLRHSYHGKLVKGVAKDLTTALLGLLFLTASAFWVCPPWAGAL